MTKKTNLELILDFLRYLLRYLDHHTNQARLLFGLNIPLLIIMVGLYLIREDLKTIIEFLK